MKFKEFKAALKEVYTQLPANEPFPTDEALKSIPKKHRAGFIKTAQNSVAIYLAAKQTEEAENEGTCTSEESAEPDPATNTIDNTLAERESNYGQFADFAELAQNLKVTFDNTVRAKGRPELFTDAMNEAIEMCFHKLARIGTGNPLYIDSARDLVGYSQLLLNEIEAQEEATDAKVVKLVKQKDKWVEL